MSSIEELEERLHDLQQECYEAGFRDAGYLIEVARLSLEDEKERLNAKRAESANRSDLPSNVVYLRA